MVRRIGQSRPLGPVFFREWREYRGLTLDQIAEDTGATRSAIQKLESGETRYSQSSLEAVAAALNVPGWRLIAGPPNPELDSEFSAASVPKEVANAINVLIAAGFGKR